jgi:hypothetical protein
MVRKAGAGCGPVADESDPPKASFQAGKETRVGRSHVIVNKRNVLAVLMIRTVDQVRE